MPPRYENELNPLLDFKVKKSFKSRYNQDEIFFVYLSQGRSQRGARWSWVPPRKIKSKPRKYVTKATDPKWRPKATENLFWVTT